uniref:NAD(P)-binding domain-containing protein n=1 Tax=viral metagenome TaxID=1070528 RepID=A0A6C0CL23_9ZZZZ
MTKAIITGGCGFIGHHLVEHLLRKTDWELVVLDRLNYASKGFERLRSFGGLSHSRVKVLTVDLSHPFSEGVLYEIGTDIDYIIHTAAETHVDNSIAEPVEFIRNNVMSTVHLLEFARKLDNLRMFFYFSTDEVFGPALGDKLFTEDERHNPTNPYSASKSSAEQICMSYNNTYKIPLIKINCMNAFGERQHVEKFIPKVVKMILNGETVKIHSYPDKKTSGTRFYIHARNIAAAVLFLIENGKIGESYNITGEREVSNLEMAQFIADVMGQELKYEMVDFHSSRPGHDLRYGLDGSKMAEMGWVLPVSFEESLKHTIEWTIKHKGIWLEE